MVDMSTTIIPKSDQLNYEDMISGPRVITITEVRAGSSDQPVKIFFEGCNGKPFLPCKTVRKLMVQAWGNEGQSYVGKSMRIYGDPSVTWAGKAVGGIRVSAMSHIDSAFTSMLSVSRGNRKPYKVDVLIVEQSKPASLDPETVLAAAKVEARKGKDAFTAYWNGPAKIGNTRELLQPHMAELSALSTNANDDDFPGDRPFEGQA